MGRFIFAPRTIAESRIIEHMECGSHAAAAQAWLAHSKGLLQESVFRSQNGYRQRKHGLRTPKGCSTFLHFAIEQTYVRHKKHGRDISRPFVAFKQSARIALLASERYQDFINHMNDPIGRCDFG